MGGRVYEYAPVLWAMSNEPDFKLPDGGRPVVCKVMTMANGDELPDSRRYRACLDGGLDWSRHFWGIWGWKYLEP
jgi:hypothetical protein